MTLIERIKLKFKGKRDNKQFIYGQETQKAIDDVLIRNKDKRITKTKDVILDLTCTLAETEQALCDLEQSNVIKYLSATRAYQLRKNKIDTARYKIRRLLKGIDKVK